LKTTVFRHRSLPRWGRNRTHRYTFGSYRVIAAGVISLTSKTNTTVNLSATDATGGNQVYTYQWYRSTSPGFTPGGGNILSGKTSLTLADTGLSSNTTYYYKLRYTDGVAATADATEFSTTTDFSGGGGGGSVFGSNVISGCQLGVL
jgi:hypothetical protein